MPTVTVYSYLGGRGNFSFVTSLMLAIFINFQVKEGEEREPNKMQPIRCLLSNFYLNMFRASLCPSSGEQDRV